MSGPLDDENEQEIEHEHEIENDSAEVTDEFDENSPTWGAADPDFDRMLRDRIGPVEPMATPPFAFERVLLSGRRRRARKLWAGAAAAAFVVMAGTAGTTVALNSGRSSDLAVTDSPSSSPLQGPSPSAQPSVTPDASASPSPSASSDASASAGAPASAPAPSATSATVPQCDSTDLNPSATTLPGSGGSSATLLLVLTNTSGHSCTTDGYPGLQFAPDGGSPLQSVVETRTSAGLKRQITVPPNGTVSSVVTYQTTASDAGGCYTPSAYVLVIPPNEQTQVMATIKGGPITVCASGAVSLTPLVSGSAD